MKTTVYIALFGWPLIALLLFAVLPPRRAVIANFVIGWLLLPVAAISLPGFIDVSKAASVAVASLVGVMLFDSRRLAAFRPGLIDLPVLGLTAAPLASSLANGLGAYDGLSGTISFLLLWGVPWLMGRLYASDPGTLRDLGIGLILGMLAYLPLFIWEMRMSPQLHASTYGFHPFVFSTTRRFGGYRPVGFLRHGIELGMWIMSAALIAIWFQVTGGVRRLLGVPMSWVVAVLLAMAVLSRAIGAWALLGVGISTLFFTRQTRSGLLIAVVILAPIGYVGARFSGDLIDGPLLSLARTVSEERAASLATRLYNEERLSEKALDRPIFGWGGWGRGRIEKEGRDDTLIDGLWIVLLSKHGLLGLLSWLAVMLLAPALVLRRIGSRRLLSATQAPVLAAVVLLPLHAMNWMLNGFVNPVYVMMAGSLAQVARSPRRVVRSGRRRRHGSTAASGPGDRVVPGGSRHGKTHRSLDDAP